MHYINYIALKATPHKSQNISVHKSCEFSLDNYVKQAIILSDIAFHSYKANLTNEGFDQQHFLQQFAIQNQCDVVDVA